MVGVTTTLAARIPLVLVTLNWCVPATADWHRDGQDYVGRSAAAGQPDVQMSVRALMLRDLRLCNDGHARETGRKQSSYTSRSPISPPSDT